MARGRNAENDKRQLAAKDWRERAVRLRRQNFSIREIASMVDRSPTIVHEAIKAALDAVPVADVEALRKEHGEKIARKLRKWSKPAEYDAEAAKVYVSLLAAERKLYGLDAPVKTEISGELKTTTAHDEILDRLTRLAAAAAAGGGDRKPDG